MVERGRCTAVGCCEVNDPLRRRVNRRPLRSSAKIFWPRKYGQLIAFVFAALPWMHRLTLLAWHMARPIVIYIRVVVSTFVAGKLH